MKTIASLFTIALLLTGCSKDNLSYGLDETIPLKMDRSAEITDASNTLSIKFVGVDENRCPPDVNCVAMGTVTIDLEIDGMFHQLRLGHPQPEDGIGVTTTHDEYTVQLISASYGKDANYGEASKYDIELTVRK